MVQVQHTGTVYRYSEQVHGTGYRVQVQSTGTGYSGQPFEILLYFFLNLPCYIVYAIDF